MKAFPYLFARLYQAKMQIATGVYIQTNKDAMKETGGGQIIITMKKKNHNLNAKTI